MTAPVSKPYAPMAYQTTGACRRSIVNGSALRLRDGEPMDKKRQDAINEQINADAPTYYANALALAVSPFDVSFTFGLRATTDTILPQARIMMSLEHALVMLMIARRTLREHQAQTGVAIQIPPSVMRDLQLDEETPLW